MQVDNITRGASCHNKKLFYHNRRYCNAAVLSDHTNRISWIHIFTTNSLLFIILNLYFNDLNFTANWKRCVSYSEYFWISTEMHCQAALLLVFSVTPFNIDQNKIQNRSIDKVQNLGNERRYIYKDPRQDSSQRNISYTRYPKKCFTQNYRDLYGDAMLVLIWVSSNMADGNQQKDLLPSFATKAWIHSSRNS